MKQKIISNEVLSAEYKAVYRYALTICKSENDAMDITQETFLNAMKNSSKFKGNSSLYTWLCAIAKNIWLNKCKKLSFETNFDNFDNSYSSDNFENALIDKELSIHIHKILHHLDEPYKEVFTLRTFGELSFRDIANLFSKTESWARVTYYRAKKNIIQTLERNGVGL